MRKSPKARQAKSKARVSAYEDLAAQEAERREDGVEINIPPGERLGDLVIDAQALKKAFGEKLWWTTCHLSCRGVASWV